MQCIDITVFFPTAEETLISVCLDAPVSNILTPKWLFGWSTITPLITEFLSSIIIHHM